MEFIILASLVAIFVGLFVGGGLLVWVTRLFKIANPSYKKSLVILIVSGVASLIAGIIFGIMNLDFLSSVLVSIATFFVFHFFYRKYYQSSWVKSLGIYIVFGITGFIVSLLIVIPTRLYIFSPFTVAGEAMSPTYNNDDYFLINKLDKSFERSDVVVHRYPKDQKQFSIKRIVGMPGETVSIQNGKVYINGQPLDESKYLPDSMQTFGTDAPLTLKTDEYYVLGDNRTNSSDSRVWGTVPRNLIIGKYWITVSKESK